MRQWLYLFAWLGLMWVWHGGSAGAEESIASLSVAVNTVWVLLAAFLVFLMQAGFAMVEAGFTRAKNAGNIIMKNVMDFSVSNPVPVVVEV